MIGSLFGSIKAALTFRASLWSSVMCHKTMWVSRINLSGIQRLVTWMPLGCLDIIFRKDHTFPDTVKITCVTFGLLSSFRDLSQLPGQFTDETQSIGRG